MAIQGAINRLIGTAGAAATLAGKLSTKENTNTNTKEEGIDAKMAVKARKIAQQKIKTIQANQEISDRAKTLRIGKVLDEYNISLGGKK